MNRFALAILTAALATTNAQAAKLTCGFSVGKDRKTLSAPLDEQGAAVVQGRLGVGIVVKVLADINNLTAAIHLPDTRIISSQSSDRRLSLSTQSASDQPVSLDCQID